MDCISALKTRRSVRAYTGEPVTREVLIDLVDCGRLAATAINIQPWEFVVVTAPPMLRAIAAATDFGKFIAQAAACIVVLCRDTKYYLEDGCNASQNILVAAHAHGLGSCWIARAGTFPEHLPLLCARHTSSLNPGRRDCPRHAWRSKRTGCPLWSGLPGENQASE